MSPQPPPIYVETSGDGPTTMLLLHGMGATGAVWRRVVDELRMRWSGRVVVCDLPRHGASGPLEDAVDIPGGGHDVHVQHPQAFVDHVLAFEMRSRRT